MRMRMYVRACSPLLVRGDMTDMFVDVHTVVDIIHLFISECH